MKRQLVLFFATVLFPLMSWAGETFTTVFDAAVYRSPNTTSDLIVTLPAGSEVTVTAIDRDNFWARISLSDGAVGYVDTGCLDAPGGTAGITETFNADEIQVSKEEKQADIAETLAAILFFLLLTAATVHMFYVRSNVDNEPRLFVGSMARIVLFAILMLISVFMVEGFWGKLFQILGALISVVFSYYAYLRPKSKLLVGGAPSKNALQILGGMWTDLENKQVDKARVSLLTQQLEKLRREYNETASETMRQQLDARMSELQQERTEEETKMNETVALTFVSVFIAIIFVWLTPFVAIVQYLRNYPLYLRKRESYQQKAGMR